MSDVRAAAGSDRSEAATAPGREAATAPGGEGAERIPDSSPGHPGPADVEVPAAIVTAIVDQARAEYPNEACGLIIGDRPPAEGGQALRYRTTRNRAASPYRYEIDPDDLLQLTLEADDADEVFWGIVHSHVGTPARPSPTDVGLAFYPDALYLLVSLATEEADPVTGAPSLRAWRIVEGVVHEVALRPGVELAG